VCPSLHCLACLSSSSFSFYNLSFQTPPSFFLLSFFFGVTVSAYVAREGDAWALWFKCGCWRVPFLRPPSSSSLPSFLFFLSTLFLFYAALLHVLLTQTNSCHLFLIHAGFDEFSPARRPVTPEYTFADCVVVTLPRKGVSSDVTGVLVRKRRRAGRRRDYKSCCFVVYLFILFSVVLFLELLYGWLNARGWVLEPACGPARALR